MGCDDELTRMNWLDNYYPSYEDYSKITKLGTLWGIGKKMNPRKIIGRGSISIFAAGVGHLLPNRGYQYRIPITKAG